MRMGCFTNGITVVVCDVSLKEHIFFFGCGETKSTWYVGLYLAYFTSPGL
jgi:hypothetical protein